VAGVKMNFAILLRKFLDSFGVKRKTENTPANNIFLNG
jgi:hypothetical protein